MPVLPAHIVDDLSPAVLAQVDVDVGVLGSIGVGEPLEEQAVPHRARVGQPEHEPDHRPDARPARQRRDAAHTTPVDEVPDDQEVRADELVGQNAQLAFEARPLFGVAGRVAVENARAVTPHHPRLGHHSKSQVAVEFELLGVECVPG